MHDGAKTNEIIPHIDILICYKGTLFEHSYFFFFTLEKTMLRKINKSSGPS